MKRLANLVILAFAMTAAAAQAPAPETPPAEAPPAEAPAAAAPAPAMTPPPAMSDQVNIVCDGKVKADGKVEFMFTPASGAASTVSVTLQKGMKEEDSCRDIAKELGVALGAGYDVERYDPNKVKVEGKKKAQFALTLGASTVEGFHVKFK